MPLTAVAAPFEPTHHRQLMFERPAWMAEAACAGRTPLFFGLAGERPERRIRREARAQKVCATCPVLAECRAMARTNGENGFWGGESEEDRARAGYPPISISRRSVQEAALLGQQAGASDRQIVTAAS